MYMYIAHNNALIARSDAGDGVSVRGRQELSRTSYIPSTHPTVMLHLKSITAMIDAASKNRDELHQDDDDDDDVFNSLTALKTTVQSLRINIAVDPVAMTFEELQTLFIEISSKEECAHATLCQYKTALSDAISDDFLVSLEVNYNFVLKSRLHLETEIMRCRPPQNASPTHHAHIEHVEHVDNSSYFEILSFDTLHRQFVSMIALMSAVTFDVITFLTNRTTSINNSKNHKNQ
jgi:hypothetical protein